MSINAIKGKDIHVDAPTHAIFRIDGHQWRVAAEGGIATLHGRWTRALKSRGGRIITGEVWIGKTKHELIINPR